MVWCCYISCKENCANTNDLYGQSKLNRRHEVHLIRGPAGLNESETRVETAKLVHVGLHGIQPNRTGLSRSGASP